MDTWDAITSRRQVRSFTDEPVTDEQLRQILEAGRRAPSGRNGQPWDFVVVTERDRLQELSGVWQGAAWVGGAAAAVAMILPEHEDHHARIMTRFDLGQAAMQMMIAATGLGVASGQAACADQDLARKILAFPDGRFCALILAFGHPADRPLRPIKNPSRRDFDDVVHYGAW